MKDGSVVAPFPVRPLAAIGVTPGLVVIRRFQACLRGGLHAWHAQATWHTGAPVMDFVFTVCDNAAKEACPVWPGQPMSAHWGVPDPAAVEGTETEVALAFAETYRMLTQRISIFCSLPLSSIDRLSLQRRLGQIGTASAAEETA